MREETKHKKGKLSPCEMERRNQMLKKLHETGDLDRLKKSLYAQLVLQESWRDDMKEKTREAVQKGGGIAEITLDEIVVKLLEHGRTSVSPSIEAELKAKIRQQCFGK